MAGSDQLLTLSLLIVGLGVCVVLRITGFLTFSVAEVLFLLALTASLAGIAVGVYWLTEASPARQLQGSVLAAGGGVGLSVCAAALIPRRGNGSA
jgi:hypothetical protein